MAQEKDPNKESDMPVGESIAAIKARATLADPELQKALAELRALTPAGEPLFGFRLKLKDARDEVPKAQQVQLEEGAAIVADTDAAAAYAEGVEPSTAPSPRMPTGKIRLSSAVAATDTRRQTTQRSIKRGGSGAPLPALAREPVHQEEVVSPAVLDRALPVRTASPTEPTSRHQRGPSTRLAPVVLVSAVVFAVVVVVGLALRSPTREDPERAMATGTPTNTAASLPPAPSIAAGATASSSSNVVSSATSAATGARVPLPIASTTPAVTTVAAPHAAPRPSVRPTASSAPTSAPSASSAPTATPSSPPTVPPAAPKPLIYD